MPNLNVKKIVFLCLMCFVVLFAYTADAANTAASVNFVRYLQDPVPEQERLDKYILRVVQGNTPFKVSFKPDETRCRAAYGKEWKQICMRSVGDILPKTQAITMQPEHPGRWQWASNTTLVFYPEKPWPADTMFTVKIGEASLPRYTKITSSIFFRTRPISTSIKADFKFDPEHYKNMMVSGSVNFNYSMNKESVLKRFQVTATDPGLLLGEQTSSFDPSLFTLYFSAPVLKMPNNAQSVSVRVVEGIEAVSGGIPGEGNTMYAKVPAKNSIFKLLSSDGNIISMPDLSAKQTFTFEFSLPVLPKDVLALTSIRLMPRERVQSMTPDAQKNTSPYRWWSTEEVSDEILKETTPVAVKLLSTPDVPTRFVTFALEKDIEAKRYLYITLEDDLKGPDDFILSTDYISLMAVPSLSGEMHIMQKGTVLVLGGEKKLALYSRNADAVRYEVSQIRPEFLSLYASQMGNTRPAFPSDSHPPTSLSIITEGEIPLNRKNAEEAQFSALDLEPFLQDGRKGLFHVRVASLLNGITQYSDNRFVMLTDIGLIRKKNIDGTATIYVVSLVDGKPMSKVVVQVLGKNGLAIFKGTSDGDGILTMPDVQSYTREKKPTVIMAQTGEDIAFLPFDDYERELDIQRFQVSGKTHVDEGLYGFIFTQRDLYRPGEEAYFGLILKQGDFDSTKLKDMPLQAYIRDPRGTIVERKRMSITATGLGDVHFAILQGAQTGVYTLYVEHSENSGVLVSKSFHVEEFQAETMRLDVAFGLGTQEDVKLDNTAKKAWFLPSELKSLRADIELMNLFGTPATGNMLRAKASVTPAVFGFEGYADWEFFDAAVLDKRNNLELGTKNTDEQGQAFFPVESTLHEKSTALLTVVVDAFDASGGNSVQKQHAIMVSPLQAVLGWKSSSYLEYIPQNDEAYLEILALDSTAQPYDYGDFTWERYEVNYVRSLVKDRRGAFGYREKRTEKLVESRRIKLPAKVISLPLDTKKPGETMLLAKDDEGRIILRVSYTVAGDALAQFGEEKNPDFRAKLNKTNYERGEEMEIYMHLPYDGAGLITIERDTVFMQEWFTGKRGERVQTIDLSDNFEGKAYVNILYFRDLEDEDVFTKPCANVILPFTANLKARELDLSLEIVREKRKKTFWDFGSKEEEKNFVVRPGTEFAVKISSPKVAKAIVYAVDEGILQMTDYQNPDPVNELLVQRALEVRTYQYFDLLMPEYSLLQKAIPAFGGGLSGRRVSDMNPFRRKGEKPAVFWSGIVDVDEDGTLVNIPVPATFNGQLRIIAVACSAESMASVEEDVLVQAEVVIQPSLPLFLAPGDIFDATIALTDMRTPKSDDAQSDKWGMVNFDVTMSPALELVGQALSEIELLYAKQKTVNLRFRVKTEADLDQISDVGENSDSPLLSVLGEQAITFMVRAKKDDTGAVSTISLPISLSVRPAQARQTRLKMGRLFQTEPLASKPDAKSLEAIVALDRMIYPQFAEISASVSPLPLPLIEALVQMLREYPYSCTEQSVSKTLPLLTMLHNKRFAPEGEKYTEEAMKEEILKTLRILTSRYKHDVSFSMWPNGYGKTPLLYTVYSADFITEAKDMGISVPSALQVDFLQELEETLSSTTPSSLESARAYAYGAWVLTRNGVVTSNILANLVAWLDQNVTHWQKDIVAPFMAASMKLMMQEKAAQQLLAGYAPDALSAWAWSSSLDGLAQRSLYLTIVAKHFPEKLTGSTAQKIVEDIIYLTEDQKYVTLSAAQAARALMLYSLHLKQESGAGEPAPYFLDAENKEIVLPGGSMPAIEQGAKPAIPQNLGENIPDRMITTDDAQIIARIAAVKYTSTVPLFYSLTSSAYDKGIPQKSVAEGIEIIREYRDLEGNIVNELKAGDDIVVAIRARSLGGALPDIIINDLLPGAFEFVIATGGAVTDVATQEGKRVPGAGANSDSSQSEQDFLAAYIHKLQNTSDAVANSNSSQSEQDMDVVYADRREDRLVLFAEIGHEESVFRYRVRVANRGDFVIPPISAEAMYNPSIHAVSNTTLGNQTGRMVVK